MSEITEELRKMLQDKLSELFGEGNVEVTGRTIDLLNCDLDEQSDEELRDLVKSLRCVVVGLEVKLIELQVEKWDAREDTSIAAAQLAQLKKQDYERQLKDAKRLRSKVRAANKITGGEGVTLAVVRGGEDGVEVERVD